MNHEEDIRFGRLALDRGFITLEQLQEGMKSVKERPGYNLEFILISLGYITSEQAKTLKQFLSQQNRLGDYKILAKIGEGGMGLVYKAVHVPTQALRALKILGSQSSKNIKDIERFIREARTTSRLNHPNIVRLFEAKKYKETYYLALEFVDGNNLEALIQEKGSLDEKKALQICRQVALALQAAHEQKIVHRDIKPENILFNLDGMVKLTDFGLAKGMDSTNITQTGYMVGTPSFVSPEQALGKKKIDIRSDIYSLGITLFYMVTGQVPYEDPSAVVVCQKHVFEALPNPRKIKPELSLGLHKLLGLMTSKKPVDRPQNPEKLIELFDALLEGKETEGGADRPTMQISKRLMRKKKGSLRTAEILSEKQNLPLVYIGGGFIGLLILLVLGWFLWGLSNKPIKEDKPNPGEKTPLSNSTGGKKNLPLGPKKNSEIPFDKLSKIVKHYEETTNWPQGAADFVSLLPESNPLQKKIKGGMSAFFQMVGFFGNSTRLLQFSQESLDEVYGKFLPLYRLWAIWQSRSDVPQEVRTFYGELQSLEHLYRIEKDRSQGLIEKALQRADQYKKHLSSTLLFDKTLSTTSRRFEIYRLYSELFHLLKTLNMDLSTHPFTKLNLLMVKALKASFSMLKGDNFTEEEIRDKLKEKGLYQRAIQDLVQAIDEKNGPEPVLGSLAWLMFTWPNNAYQLASSGLYDTANYLFQERRSLQIKVPQGMDALVQDSRLLLTESYLCERLFQRNPLSQRGVLLLSLCSSLLSHRAEQKGPGVLKPLFCYTSAERLKRGLKRVQEKIPSLFPPSEMPISINFDLSRESGFFLLSRGDLISQKLSFQIPQGDMVNQMGIFFPKERYDLPLEQVLPGRLKTLKLYLQLNVFSECALQLDQGDLFRVFQNRRAFFCVPEKGRFKKILPIPPTPARGVYTVQNTRVVLILEVDKRVSLFCRNWRMIGKTKKDLQEYGDKWFLGEVPLTTPKSSFHQVIRVYLKDATLAFLNESWTFSRQNFSESLESLLKAMKDF